VAAYLRPNCNLFVSAVRAVQYALAGICNPPRQINRIFKVKARTAKAGLNGKVGNSIWALMAVLIPLYLPRT
jgi:hypothetical protein